MFDKENYRFRLAEEKETETVFALIKKRVRWMDDKSLSQWNTNGYLEAYPLEYYREQQRVGNLYVLEKQGDIVGTAVLLEQDERWPEMTDEAYYIHNFATLPSEKGTGRLILELVEELAAEQGKEAVRLDCNVDSPELNNYYGSKGYEERGTFNEGRYRGVRREKRLAAGS